MYVHRVVIQKPRKIRKFWLRVFSSFVILVYAVYDHHLIKCI